MLEKLDPLITTPEIEPPVMFTLDEAKLVAFSAVKSPLDGAVAPIGVLLILPPAIVTAVELNLLIVPLDAITPLVTDKLLIVAVLLTWSWSTFHKAVE